MDINCRCSVLYLVNGKRPELIDKYMEDGMTEKQALKKAKEEIKPNSLAIPYMSYKDWYKSKVREKK
ncbi:hypothetical protein [Peribacillus butanolivorans]|uniref:hypothetical protein n=1 Tax=Peribacillus butanolivorans TaxID=421767 RepID=UPI0038107F32